MATETSNSYNRYMQSILLLIIVLAVFELMNSGLNVALLLQQNQESKERSIATRQTVIAVGYCLKQRDVNTKPEIERCVEKVLGRPLTPVGDLKTGESDGN